MMQHSIKSKLFGFALVVALVSSTHTSLCLCSEQTRISLKESQQRWLVKKLGGSLQIVEGQVNGVVFESEYTFIVGEAPNEVIEPSVTDETLAVVKSFPTLKHVRLAEVKITDKGMRHIATVPELRELNIERTSITERGLKYLAKCKHLKKVVLSDMKVSAAGIRSLASGMSLANTLQELSLVNCTIDDRTVSALDSFPSLTVLRLSDNVSDKSVKHLIKLTELKELHLNSTSISLNGVAALKKALPNTQVVWKPPQEPIP